MSSTKLKVSLTLAIATCCFASTVNSRGIIKGRVVDSEGAVIKDAYVLFHPDPSGQITRLSGVDVTRETDAMGRFNLQLEPGFYDMCVMAAAFTPECHKILVTSGKVAKQDAQLKADALVTAHLGDRF